ncbi:lipoyl(octanoyl) transferase LipB [Polyangium spumosum]|uniref:lipoyl(octanoyl) transferase LipB n=1 Tax=Polyangium spumosum TaxID=889282 RepID=UPI003083F305
MGARHAKAVFLGRRRYEPIHELQRHLVALRADGHIEDIILLVEHEPVVTLGRAADEGNVLRGKEALAELGVDLVQTGRGGDVTYHGPGQLVCYPILDLRPDRCDVRRYVRSLAEVMILLARDLGVEAGVVDGLIGVWADRDKPTEWAGAPWASELAKLGAIGVRLTRWVTMHGFAFNLNVDLRAFQLIVPCGIRDHGVTSIEELTGNAPSVRDVALGCHEILSRGLDVSVSRVEDMSDVSDLERALTGEARSSSGPAEQKKPASG